MPRVQTCPKCRALLEPGTRRCPYCETDQSAARARSPEADAAATTRVGVWLILANVILYFLCVQLDPLRGDGEPFRPSYESLVAFGASSVRQIGECGQYWRLVTANFLHLDVMHLLFNCVALFIIIPMAAITFGLSRTIVLYFTTGALGITVSHMAGINGAGASAAICGMIAALAMYGKRRGAPHLTRQMVGWAFFIMVIGYLFRFDSWGHAGGLAAGAALGWPASAVRAMGGRTERLWWTGAVACLVAAAVVLGGFQAPSVVRSLHRREAVTYRKDIDRTLAMMRDVASGLAEAKDLPDSIKEGPGDSAQLVGAINNALQILREDRARGLLALNEATLLWYRWQNDMACSHHIQPGMP